MNLRPDHYSHHRPQYFKMNGLNSNQFTWRYLNRTLYRDHRDFWLRRVMHKQHIPQDILKLKEKYGMKFIHSEQDFYKLFKIRRVDFLAMIEAKGEQAIEDVLYAPDVGSLGRRGVESLEDSIDKLRKRWRQKERLNQFAEKFAGQSGMTPKEFRQ